MSERSVWIAMTAEETALEGQERPHRTPLNLQMCQGVGLWAIEKNGVSCCPVCGDPIAKGCGSSRWQA